MPSLREAGEERRVMAAFDPSPPPTESKAKSVLGLSPVARRLFRCLSTEDKAKLPLLSRDFGVAYNNNLADVTDEGSCVRGIHVRRMPDYMKPGWLPKIFAHVMCFRLLDLNLDGGEMEAYAFALIQSQAASLRSLSVRVSVGGHLALPKGGLSPLAALKSLELSGWPACAPLLRLAPPTLRSLAILHDTAIWDEPDEPRPRDRDAEADFLNTILKGLLSLERLKLDRLLAETTGFWEAMDEENKARLAQLPRLEMKWENSSETAPTGDILSEMQQPEKLSFEWLINQRMSELQPSAVRSLRSLKLQLTTREEETSEDGPHGIPLSLLCDLPDMDALKTLTGLRSLQLRMSVDNDADLLEFFRNWTSLPSLPLESLAVQLWRFGPGELGEALPLRLPSTLKSFRFSSVAVAKCFGRKVRASTAAWYGLEAEKLETLVTEPTTVLRPVLEVAQPLAHLRCVEVEGHPSAAQSLLGDGSRLPALQRFAWRQSLAFGQSFDCCRAHFHRLFLADSGGEMARDFHLSMAGLKRDVVTVLKAPVMLMGELLRHRHMDARVEDRHRHDGEEDFNGCLVHRMEM